MEPCTNCNLEIVGKSISCYYCREKTHLTCLIISPLRLALYLKSRCRFRCEPCCLKLLQKLENDSDSLVAEATEYLNPTSAIQINNLDSITDFLSEKKNETEIPDDLSRTSKNSSETDESNSSICSEETLTGENKSQTTVIEGISVEEPSSENRNKYENNSTVQYENYRNGDLNCKFYLAGYCKYQAEECNFNHPKMCKWFLNQKRNSKYRDGCRFGEDCRYLHPSLCFNLENYGKCHRSLCPFFHRRCARQNFQMSPHKRNLLPEVNEPFTAPQQIKFENKGKRYTVFSSRKYSLQPQIDATQNGEIPSQRGIFPNIEINNAPLRHETTGNPHVYADAGTGEVEQTYSSKLKGENFMDDNFLEILMRKIQPMIMELVGRETGMSVPNQH